MSNNKVKVGIIGLGAIGSVHADAYNSTPGAEITAVCDVSDARLSEIGNKYNVKHHNSNWGYYVALGNYYYLIKKKPQ